MTNDEKKTLLQQRYAELDDESLCALERHKLTEQARELFDAELARRGLDLAAYEARHGDSLYRSRTALRQRQWRGVGLKAILAGVIFAGAALVRQSGRHGGPARGCRRPGPGHPRAGLCPAPPLRYCPCRANFAEAPELSGDLPPCRARITVCIFVPSPAVRQAQTSAHYDSFPSCTKNGEMP